MKKRNPLSITDKPLQFYDPNDRRHRGGNWYFSAWYHRVSFRDVNDPSLRFGNFGFRLCRTTKE